MDFTDLNKAYPKDYYPLPYIDKLVDAIAGYEMLSFIDAYSGYHQVKLAEQDKPLTTIRAACGFYSYKMMHFGFKNTGVNYQRMINKIFDLQLGRNFEAYIDDMVVKTIGRDHVQDLEETFSNLRKHIMKLNPIKCVFGVRAGKFLGFMVNERGIEGNPEDTSPARSQETH